MQDNKTVLYLDDNEDHRELLKYLFEDAGFNILTCACLQECLDYLVAQPISTVVMDYWIEGAEAVTVAEKIKTLYPQIPFFFFTGDAQPKSRERGLKIGAQQYFVKPDDLGNIVPAVGRFLEAAH